MKNSTDQNSKVLHFFEQEVLPDLYHGKRDCGDLLNYLEQALQPFENQRQAGRQM